MGDPLTFETALTTYGVLGIWTSYLLYEKHKVLSRVNKTLENLHRLIDKKL